MQKTVDPATLEQALSSEGPNGTAAASWPSVKKKAQSQKEATLNDKRQHLDSIDAYTLELAEKLNKGDHKALQQVLDFFGTGRKCARWSYWNLIGLLRQRPDIQRPVTVRAAAEVGHYVRRGVKPVAILVPRVIELCSSQEPKSSLKNDKLPWKANAAQRLELFPDHCLLQVWQEPSGEWAWLNATYPERTPIASGTAASLPEAQDRALASLNEEQLRDLAKASAPKPKTRTYFNLVGCVVDLGRDTVGPSLMSDLDQTGEDVGHILEAITGYARSIGVEAIAHRRSVEDLVSGSIGTAWEDDKVYVSDTLSPERKIGVWIHELTHWLTHLRPEANVSNTQSSGSGERPARHIRELQAEACSYVVSRSLGLRSEFSIGYLQGWNITKLDLELNMRVIVNTSRELLQGITPLIRGEARDVMEDGLVAIRGNPAIDEAIPESWEQFQKALQDQEDSSTTDNEQAQDGLSPIKARIRATI